MSKNAEVHFESIATILATSFAAVSGQMFGKRCVKVNGKACLALFQECLVFKLSGPEHATALKLPGASLWDPSGKGRAMKDWVQVPATASQQWEKLAQAAARHVAQLSAK